MKLSDRMEAIAAMVSPCRVLADIGTDHAHVPIALAERGVADAAIAMDVREGPLARARENIADAGLEERVEVRLSDGTAALTPGEADVILIAGMGGALMRRILQDGSAVTHVARELVLQPQSELAKFRHFLWDEGYRILDENMVYEDGKYYTIIKAVWRKNAGEKEPITINMQKILNKQAGACDDRPNSADAEIMTKDAEIQTQDADRISAEETARILAEYGPCLLARRHPILFEFLQKEQRKLQKILESLPPLNASAKQWEDGKEYNGCPMAADDRIAKRRMELGEKLRQNRLAQQFIQACQTNL